MAQHNHSKDTPTHDRRSLCLHTRIEGIHLPYLCLQINIARIRGCTIPSDVHNQLHFHPACLVQHHLDPLY